MGKCGTLCARLLAVVVALVAIFVGWLRTDPFPEAKIFSNIYPLTKGFPPKCLGPWKNPGTREVPPDMKPEPKPEGETSIGLPGGGRLPQVGLGTCCRPTAYDDETVYRTVLWYLLLGGRHVDTADIYLNHRPIGRAIAEAMERGVPRSDIFVTTKVFPRHFGRGRGLQKVRQFLDELGLDYLDLVLLHAPSQMPLLRSTCSDDGLDPKECREETWKSLSDARSQGLVKDVGVSNFNVRQMEEILALAKDGAAAPLAVNQFMYNPWASDWLHETFEYCRENGIAVVAWSSLAGTAMQTHKTLKVRVLQEVAAAHGKTTMQILLRWAVQRGAAVIPGTGNPDHMRENLSVFGFELSAEEVAKIDALRNDASAKEFFPAPIDES